MSTTSLDMSDKRFDYISNRIADSYPDSCILWIDEVTNDDLFVRYTLKKNEMENLYPNEMEELQLFHGTNEDNIPLIVEEGFKSHLNKRSAYGKGNYFAKNANYSKSYMTSENKITFMFLCDVLVGRKITPGTKTVLEPCQCFVSSDTIYVIPEDDAVYPRYVIAFHKNPPK